jgi:type IV pilus assembly protein PilM
MFWDAFLPKKRQLIGLDIGSQFIKLVEFEDGKKGSQTLRSLGVAQLPPEAINEGNIQDPAAVAETIKRLLDNCQPATRSVATSISGYSVIVRTISMAKTTQELLEESIHWEAEQYIPFDINDVNIDFQVLGDSEANPDQMDVMLVAAKKDTIDTFGNLLRSAGLNPAVIEVDSFAMGNAYELNYGNGDSEGCTALIDIGAEKMNINILRRGTPALTRDASFGGRQITERIQRDQVLTFEQAEALKLSGGADPEAAKAVEAACQPVLSAWAAEIGRSIELFSATYPSDRIERIVLSGGSSRVSGLVELLSSQTGVAVEMFNPFARVEHDEKTFDRAYLDYVGPQFAISTGLALRKVGDR